MKKLSVLVVTILAFAQLTVAQSAGPIQIASLTTATGYEAHEPVGASQVFTSHDRIFAAIVASNSGDAHEVRVSFERVDATGEGARGVTLEIPRSRRYRTVARTAGLAAGQYRVVVRDQAGATLSESTFTVNE